MKNLTPLLLIALFLISATHYNQKAKPEVEDVRTIEIKENDQMKFDVTEIKATPGEEIKIILTTTSNLPKIAIAHNVVILKFDTDIKAFANASAAARDNNYIAPEFEDQIMAATPLAGGGETVEVTFTVPNRTDSYSYICSFSGHFMAGMKGTLTVEGPADTSK